MAHRVLIVEDEPNIVVSLEFLLDHEGYEVQVATSGPEALERSARRLRAVDELGVEDRVRLLPHQERPDVRRRLVAGRAGHLRPACAGVSLPGCRGPRFRQDGVVVAEASLEQRQPVPECELRRVPPVHFEMELPFPAVERQPAFLRREASRALDGGQVL